MKEWTGEENPQTIWKAFKEEVRMTAQNCQKKAVPMRAKLVELAKKQIKKINNDRSLDEDTKIMEGSLLEERRERLEHQMHQRVRTTMKGHQAQRLHNLTQEPRPRPTVICNEIR